MLSGPLHGCCMTLRWRKPDNNFAQKEGAEMGYSDFPFTMEQVVELLQLQVRHRRPVSIDVDCPFCGRRGKMNINLQKQTYRCNYCDDGTKSSPSSGGMLKLYAGLHGGLSLSDAYREICGLLHVGGYQATQNPRQTVPAIRQEKLQEIPQAALAPIEVRHKTYSVLFSLLALSPAHRENLLRRGLTEKDIQRYGYKSAPVLGFTKLAAAVLERGCTVEGVPGFYVNGHGEWTINFHARSPGFLVPVLDTEGRIQGAQIRLDHPMNKRKYIWLSSSERNLGVSSGSPVHFVGNPHAKTVIFTEGGLKGTVAHCLTGETFLCNAGASQSSNLIALLPVLKERGVKEIQAAYDMDLKTNEHVRRGCLQVLRAATELGLRARRKEWDAINKGIDDNAWAKKLRQMLCDRIASQWPQNAEPTLKKRLLEEFQQYRFCADTLVYLWFDNTVEYLAEKSRLLLRAPMERLIWEIEQDRTREGGK